MTALRQEALQMVNDMPENLLAALIETIQNFKIQNETPTEDEKKYPFTKEELQEILDSDIDPKKAAALKGIEEWQERNKEILNSGIDWDKELEEALNEKYGVIG